MMKVIVIDIKRRKKEKDKYNYQQMNQLYNKIYLWN